VITLQSATVNTPFALLVLIQSGLSGHDTPRPIWAFPLEANWVHSSSRSGQNGKRDEKQKVVCSIFCFIGDACGRDEDGDRDGS
jgi:hypothetical protein